MTAPDQYIDAETAADLLGVSRATLYAYVSRGQIHTSGSEGDPRRRLYSAYDIDELVKRKSVGRRPRAIAETTLDWGLPVLPSAITLIDEGRLYYRGRDAAHLAETLTLEDTARLLWDCGRIDPFADPANIPERFDPYMTNLVRALPLTERCQSLLPLVAAGRTTAWQRNARALWPGAASLIRAMAGAASCSSPDGTPVHSQLAREWECGDVGGDLIRRALVLLADHELNASAFAVRVVASTGASLGACINAGLSALSGPLHGGTTSLVELLFDDVRQAGSAAAAVETRLRRGDGVPGFSHPLYPEGDPRAEALLPLLPRESSRDDLIAVMEDTAGKRPNIDFALVSLRRALGLPRGSALALFAVGRSVGWIAHALEQNAEGSLIRPRARYAGPAPED